MADSEDEYDRKRRDKFRGERSSGESYRSERRDDRRMGGGAGGARDDWVDRNPFRGGGGAGRPRPDYRDYRGARDRFGSPGREMPPAKRMRPDWGDDLRGHPRFGGYDPYLMHAWNEHYAAHAMHAAPYGGGGHPHAPHARDPPSINNDTLTQPAMLTLKQFLDTQDDGISDAEVLRKYSEYKLEFKRQQLNEFFVAHKDEEWFKNKYHPIESVKRKEEQLGFLKKRVEVFTELLDNGQIRSVSIDTSQTDPLLRLLDTVVIKLEGGTEEDLKILDEKPRDPPVFPERNYDKKIEHDDDVIITSVTTKPVEDDTEPQVVSPRPIRQQAHSDDEENWDDDEDDTPAKPIENKKDSDVDSPKKEEEQPKHEKKSLKRKRTNSDSSRSSSSSSSSSSDSSSDEDEKNEKYNLSLDDVPKKEEPEIKEETEIGSPDEKIPLEQKDNENAVNSIDEIKKETTSPQEDTPKTPTTPTTPVTPGDDNTPRLLEIDESTPKETFEQEEPVEKKEEEAQPETIDLVKEKDGPQPRALHRTSSIFLRNLAPSITKAEIEEVCQRFEGYLRVAIADPLVERRWYRRGWVTFKRDVNIKEICWNLNNMRLRDCEMGAIVNRDLSRRVRPVNGMTAHKTILRADIKLCAKITMNLDERFKLWDDVTDHSNNVDKSNGNSSFGFKSNNPVLQNITDYLIEEASAEEEELLGIAGDNKDTDADVLERDPQLISVLDCLILYLRVVHSVDFYNHCEYPYEDEMPNRCGIIHARGPPPSKISQHDLQDYIKNFDSKMQTFLAKTTTIEADELKNLGCKNAEDEVEKFIQANTQELAKDKWLCPLSGKKFKGPEFIRKHIFNKHGEKVEEVRKEVEFFNNYLKDPKRPQLPEHPGSSKRHNSESSGGGGGGGYRPPMYPPTYAPPYAAYAPPMMMPGRGPRGFGGGRRELPMEHQRRIIGYHDLDAPANFDMFD